jgi:2-deoxy-D-gluconate 3-dehydrogenase
LAGPVRTHSDAAGRGATGNGNGALAGNGRGSALTAPSRTARLFELTGRVALVTGAHSGVGQAVAVGLAEAGADLVLLGGGSAYETAAAVRAAGRTAHQVPADLSDMTTVGPICRRLLADREVDILVTDMATVGAGSRRQPAAAGWRQALAEGLDAAFVLAQFLGWPMTHRGAGKVITIAATPSVRGRVLSGAYTATRNGVAGLAKALAGEWAALGVQANAVMPAPAVPEHQPSRVDGWPELPGAGRTTSARGADARNLVGAVVFLASSASDYVNGQTLVVDGGRPPR